MSPLRTSFGGSPVSTFCSKPSDRLSTLFSMRRRIAFTCASGFCCSFFMRFKSAMMLSDSRRVCSMMRRASALAFLMVFSRWSSICLRSFSASSRSFTVSRRRNLALAFRHLPVIFRIGDNVLKAHRIAGQQLLRVVNEVFRQTQTAADFKGVGLARHANRQAVGRAQRLHIELDGSVLHALGGQCECL